MSGILYIVIAVITFAISLYVGAKIARKHRTPLVKDQFMDSVVNSIAVTVASLAIGALWIFTVPLIAIGYGVFRTIHEKDEA